MAAARAGKDDAGQDDEHDQHAPDHERGVDWQAQDAMVATVAHEIASGGGGGLIAVPIARAHCPGVRATAVLDRRLVALRDGRSRRRRRRRCRRHVLPTLIKPPNLPDMLDLFPSSENAPS